MEGELELLFEIVVPAHGLFFWPVGIDDDFLVDAAFPVVISSRSGHVPILGFFCPGYGAPRCGRC
jgi:hypothetical protein